MADALQASTPPVAAGRLDAAFADNLSERIQHLDAWLVQYGQRTVLDRDISTWLRERERKMLAVEAVAALTTSEKWLIEQLVHSMTAAMAGADARVCAVLSPRSMQFDDITVPVLLALCRDAAGMPEPMRPATAPGDSRAISVAMPVVPSMYALAARLLTRLDPAASVPEEPQACLARLYQQCAAHRIKLLIITHLGAEHLGKAEAASPLSGVLNLVEEMRRRGISVLLSAAAAMVAGPLHPDLLPFLDPGAVVIDQYDTIDARNAVGPYWAAMGGRTREVPSYIVDVVSLLRGQRQCIRWVMRALVQELVHLDSAPGPGEVAEAVGRVRQLFSVPLAWWAQNAAKTPVEVEEGQSAWLNYLPPPPHIALDLLRGRHGIA